MSMRHSIDHCFSNLMRGYVKTHDFNTMSIYIKDIDIKLDKILTKINGEKPLKEFYTIKDLSTLIGQAEDTVRKKYIRSGKVKAHIP